MNISPPTGFGPPPSGNIMLPNFGPKSQVLTCPYCHNSVNSKIECKATTRTHIIALVLCLLMCWPCCLFPYCMESCQSKNHYCPQCNAFLGAYIN